ncbi:hypothetical protein [Achromobacter xylosoxidans]|uniref:hypothetical protein n=1 Tax=Alcaligenes xylosoxydans xylosoxydans TaxID=85698 RepID=UPI002A75F549|nr:hypothetical protein [Achromobacter xylosoxidans]WPQ35221.1 hypothetical protein SLH34_32265 [Achromobacter xylosoxidans]
MTNPNTQPGAAPATGNTEKEQEMYAAGIRTGEENAKHNAAIRAGAPGASTVEDERQAFEAWAKRKKMPLARIGQQYDDFWVDHAWNGWQARATLDAPAAGDALDAARYRWLCDKFGITKLPCAIERIIQGSYVADGKAAIDAAIDTAIAAQQGKGGA